MQLLPRDIVDRLPSLNSQAELGEDAIALVAFYAPWNGWVWYACEYDRQTRIFFGVVVAADRQYDYFRLDDLEALSGPGEATIQRAPLWLPRSLKRCH